MESYIAASEVELITSLSYSQPKIASYITSRKQVSIAASGGENYGPATVGSKIARFSLNSSGPFLDLSTLCVYGTVNNREALKGLQILGPSLGALIHSARLLIGGIEVDRCDWLNRTEAMLSLMQSEDKRRQDYSEGFGYEAGGPSGTDFTSTPIAANGSRKVIWRPKALGSLLGTNYVPVALTSGGSCVLELTFVDTPGEVCNTSTPSTMSNAWSVSGLSVLMDVITVDSAFLSSLGAHLAGGASLQLGFKAYQTSFYSVLAQAAQITHSRSNTRLNTLFVTFMKPEVADTNKKACNLFYIPNEGTLKMRCQIGEQRYPDSLDNDSMSLFYHRLLHAMGAANSASHSPCLTSGSFKDDGFIACQDFEAVPGQANHSGKNTFSSQLTVFLESLGNSGGPAGAVSAAYITTYHDIVVEITSNGVTVVT